MIRAVLVLLGACGPFTYGGGTHTAVPVGWTGTPRNCEGARLESGDALVPGAGRHYTAVKPGEVHFVCPDGTHETQPVVRLGRLAIEGPAHVPGIDAANPRYQVKAYAANGEALDFGDPDGAEIAWTTTAGTIGIPPRNDMAWWASRTPDVVELSAPPGKVTIGVTVGTLSTTLDLQIDPHR